MTRLNDWWNELVDFWCWLRRQWPGPRWLVQSQMKSGGWYTVFYEYSADKAHELAGRKPLAGPGEVWRVEYVPREWPRVQLWDSESGLGLFVGKRRDERTIPLLGKALCPVCEDHHCYGNEIEPPDDPCGYCNGDGYVQYWKWTWFHFRRRVIAPPYWWLWKRLHVECPACHGSGNNPDFDGPWVFENRDLFDCPLCKRYGDVWIWKRWARS